MHNAQIQSIILDCVQYTKTYIERQSQSQHTRFPSTIYICNTLLDWRLWTLKRYGGAPLHAIYQTRSSFFMLSCMCFIDFGLHVFLSLWHFEGVTYNFIFIYILYLYIVFESLEWCDWSVVFLCLFWSCVTKYNAMWYRATTMGSFLNSVGMDMCVVFYCCYFETVKCPLKIVCPSTQNVPRKCTWNPSNVRRSDERAK